MVTFSGSGWKAWRRDMPGTPVALGRRSSTSSCRTSPCRSQRTRSSVRSPSRTRSSWPRGPPHTRQVLQSFFCFLQQFLPLPSTKWVRSTFSSHCPLSSKQSSWSTTATLKKKFKNFRENWEYNPGQLCCHQVLQPLPLTKFWVYTSKVVSSRMLGVFNYFFIFIDTTT